MKKVTTHYGFIDDDSTDGAEHYLSVYETLEAAVDAATPNRVVYELVPRKLGCFKVEQKLVRVKEYKK